MENFNDSIIFIKGTQKGSSGWISFIKTGNDPVCFRLVNLSRVNRFLQVAVQWT